MDFKAFGNSESGPESRKKWNCHTSTLNSGDVTDVDAYDDELPVPLRDDDDAGAEEAVRGGRSQEVLQGNRPGALSS